MSAGYAERLKEYPNKGKCGLPENYDTSRSLTSKISTLANLLNESSYTVVLTGAGISTSAGIPDFRGPNGIWTREQERLKLLHKQKKKRKRVESDNKNNNDDDDGDQIIVEQLQQHDREEESSNNNESSSSPSFVAAKPTVTHRALAHLITTKRPKNDNNNDNNNNNSHYLQHIITQNIDGLHGKTTLPRSHLSILHGDIFTEKCPKCHTEYIRNYEISTIGLQPTGRYCTTVVGDPPGSCSGALIDTLLDWEDALPEVDWERSQEECARAELILCLGTSLRIEPAGGLCSLGTSDGFLDAGADEWDLNDVDTDDGGGDAAKEKSKKSKKKKGKRRKQKQPKKLGYVIVNLQETPYDDQAALVIRAKVDDVMERLMCKLGYGSGWDRCSSGRA